MVNEFSGLNNISMDTDYATMLGYTQKELEENFAGSIGQGIKDTGMGREAYLAKVREMYDGYRFAPGCETVYNPVSVGSFFDGSDGGGVRVNDYWIDTGGSVRLHPGRSRRSARPTRSEADPPAGHRILFHGAYGIPSWTD